MLLHRSMMGAGSPLYAHGLFVNLGIDWGSSLLGFLSVAFIPLPFLLYKVRVNFAVSEGPDADTTAHHSLARNCARCRRWPSPPIKVAP